MQFSFGVQQYQADGSSSTAALCDSRSQQSAARLYLTVVCCCRQSPIHHACRQHVHSCLQFAYRSGHNFQGCVRSKNRSAERIRTLQLSVKMIWLTVKMIRISAVNTSKYERIRCSGGYNGWTYLFEQPCGTQRQAQIKEKVHNMQTLRPSRNKQKQEHRILTT